MSELTKVRMQILDAETDEVLEEVDVLSSASSILFPDGINLEEKIDQIEKMEGPQGPRVILEQQVRKAQKEIQEQKGQQARREPRETLDKEEVIGIRALQ